MQPYERCICHSRTSPRQSSPYRNGGLGQWKETQLDSYGCEEWQRRQEYKPAQKECLSCCPSSGVRLIIEAAQPVLSHPITIITSVTSLLHSEPEL